MKDWTYKTRTFDVEKPRIHVVPAGESPPEERPKGGFVKRYRGDTTGTVKHTYRCPVHGLFDEMVPRNDVPDMVLCTSESWSINDSDVEYPSRNAAEDHVRDVMHAGLDEVMLVVSKCQDYSHWAGSTCGIGHAAGEVES